ncbi:MAG: DUF2188 domain-containing protein [Bacilli bacterium]|jgi:hypothetical protein
MKTASVGFLVVSFLSLLFGATIVILANILLSAGLSLEVIVDELTKIFTLAENYSLISIIVYIAVVLFSLLAIGIFVLAIVKNKKGYIALSILSLLPISGFLLGAVILSYSLFSDSVPLFAFAAYLVGYWSLLAVTGFFILLSLLVAFFGLLFLKKEPKEKIASVTPAPNPKLVDATPASVKPAEVEVKVAEEKKLIVPEVEQVIVVNSAPFQEAEPTTTNTSDSTAVYHISQRKDLNKWQVKKNQAEKAIKLFVTQKEAIEYAEGLAKSQGGSIRVHGMDGKIRKN